MAVWELKDSPELDWCIEGILPAGSVGMLYAPSGAGKSFVALSMALACGLAPLDWFGHPVPLHRPTVYVAGEGYAGLKIRIGAWLQRYGGDELVPCFIRPEPLNLLDEGEVAAFIEQLNDPNRSLLRGLVPEW